MATIEILADRVDIGGHTYGPGDTVSGKEKNLRPLVDSKSARWANEDQNAGTEGWDQSTWEWTVPETRERVSEVDDPTVLREWHRVEARHPQYDGGRKGVKDAIEERLGELTTERPAEGLSRGPEA